MNNVSLIGRLTKDVELRKTSTGKDVASFTLAVERIGGTEKQTDFINCKAWNKTAEVLNNYTKKGTKIGVSGSIQTGSYDDQQGKKVYYTEVLVSSVDLIEPKNNAGAQATTSQQQPNPTFNPDAFATAMNPQPNNATTELGIDAFDLPF